MESEIGNLRELVDVALKTITEQCSQIKHYKMLLEMKERSDSQKEDVPAEKHPEASVNKESEDEKNRQREEIRLGAMLRASRSFEIGVVDIVLLFNSCFALLYLCFVIGRFVFFPMPLWIAAMTIVECLIMWLYGYDVDCRTEYTRLSIKIKNFEDGKLKKAHVSRKDGDFSVSFKTSEFAPEELEMSVVGDSIVIKGRRCGGLTG
ncbi:hypothetical protein QR680_010880 [Steinernema hermaphroditum]|uniref:Uncharacterized protein n=1 Tax=Steinernema hermaphroditum TaxID=289476 RepID=A0AA39IQE5_9BILA|nr:hypothetical protein QR680_010880 [Steinernema hermaphroditum]